MCLWVHPTNKNYILAGADGGGLWRTLDGGLHWENITDNSPNAVMGTMGILSIAVDPQNEDNIYLSTTPGSSPEYGGRYWLGLAYSTDGGSTWQTDYNFRYVANYGGTVFDEIPKIAYSPHTNKLYAVHKSRLYVKNNMSSPWQDITPLEMAAKCNLYGIRVWDWEFTLNATHKIVFSTEGNSPFHYLFVYNEDNASWVTKTIDFPAWDICRGIADIAISSTNKVFINGYEGGDETHKLYTADLNIAGGGLDLVNDQLHATARFLTVSPSNPSVIYLTNCRGVPDYIEKSIDGGGDFDAMPGGGHGDGRALFLDASNVNPLNDVIYIATDGGITMKPSGTETFHSIVGDGLIVMQFEGMGSSQSHNMLIGGAIDNGNNGFIKNGAITWRNYTSGDGMIPAFSRSGVNNAYTQTQFGFDRTWVFNSTTLTSGFSSSPGNPPNNDINDSKWWRPVQFNQNNLARTGFHCMWQKQLGSTSAWVPCFGVLPEPDEPKGKYLVTDAEHSKTKKPRDFIFPEKFPDMAYIAYGDNEGDPTQSDDLKGKLFFASNLNDPNATSIDWKNITPPYSDANSISNIEIDPEHPNRIWVSFAGVKWNEVGQSASNREGRVIYHDNYGKTALSPWIDVSKGLPALPIIEIIYVEGSDDVLFAATDVGVFRWNKALAQWECFNNGIPKCSIADIEINYCSGKLVAATHGRGMWETDYAENMANVTPGFTNTITTNTTWNTSKTIHGSILVKAGATFTIEGSATTIYMPRRGRILVERGAKLVVNGATITNECDGALWAGIEIMGNNNFTTDPANQGVLEINNNAHLKHAQIAISNFYIAGVNRVSGGGIIRARDCFIENCIQAVSLRNTPNHSYYNSALVSNCSFNNVTFLKNDLNYGNDVNGHFQAWNVKGGVEVIDCHFTYDVPWTNLGYDYRYHAINIQSSGMKITGCDFEGFQFGVYASDWTGSPAKTVNVYNNHFNHVSESIWFAGDSYGIIQGNSISNMYPYKDGQGNVRHPVGIYLNSTRGAYVGCTNLVDGSVDGGPYSGTTRLGFACFAGGYYGNAFLHGNTFINLDRAIQPQANNPLLSITCNQLTNNVYGFSVNPETGAYPNTLKNQGNGCGNLNDRANNHFYGNSMDIASFLDVPWDYYAGNEPDQMPVTWSGNFNVIAACGNEPKRNCFTSLYRCTNLPWNWRGLELSNAVINFQGFVSNGLRADDEAQMLYGDIIRGYYFNNNTTDLITFLVDDADDQSRKLLIPLYIQEGRYSDATDAISHLSVTNHQRTAYTNYYGLLATLRQNNRTPDSLTTTELAMVQSIADDSVDVTPYAKSLLEWNYGIKWIHPIEEIQMSPLSGKAAVPESADHPLSKLGNATPNPAKAKTAIYVLVSEADAYRKPVLTVKNSAGTIMFNKALRVGENSIDIDTEKWPSGVYFYSLYINGKMFETRKLSVVQ